MAHIHKINSVCVSAHAIKFTVVNGRAVEILSVAQLEFLGQWAAEINCSISAGYLQHPVIIDRLMWVVIDQIIAIGQFYQPQHIR